MAASSIHADFISPAGTSYANPSNATDPTQKGYVTLVTKAMVDLAHEKGMGVKPWTINRLNVVEQLVEMGVDGQCSLLFQRERAGWGERGKERCVTDSRLRASSCVFRLSGIITDYPRDVRVWAEYRGLKVAPKANEKRVKKCLKKHNQVV